MATVTHYDSDGATPITGKELPAVTAGVTATALKFGIENVYSRPLANEQLPLITGGGDGLAMSRLVADSLTISRPYGGTNGGPTATLSAPAAGGVWGATGIYGWKVTALNSRGETVGSLEATANVSDVTMKVTLAWTQVAGATSYKVYRTSTAGTYGAATLRATIGSGATVTYLDDGTATSTGTPPSVNTTGGWAPTLALSAFGAGGAWGATGTVYYRIAGRDALGTIVASSYEVSITVDDTTKKVTLTWAALNDVVVYDVYRSTAAGSYLAALRTATAGLSFVDDGGSLGAGDLTEAASYGSPPLASTFGTNPLPEGTLARGQQAFYWFNRVTPLGTDEDGNDRVVVIIPRET